MDETSAPTPEHVNREKIRSWASDWSDAFAQDWTEEKLSAFVHKTVKADGEFDGEPKGFEGFVIGYSIDTIRVPVEDDESEGEDVHRFSLVIDEGLACPIFAGMNVEEVSEDAD